MQRENVHEFSLDESRWRDGKLPQILLHNHISIYVQNQHNYFSERKISTLSSQDMYKEFDSFILSCITLEHQMQRQENDYKANEMAPSNHAKLCSNLREKVTKVIGTRDHNIGSTMPQQTKELVELLLEEPIPFIACEIEWAQWADDLATCLAGLWCIVTTFILSCPSASIGETWRESLRHCTRVPFKVNPKHTRTT